MMLPANIIAAMDDPAWFANSFAGPSWDRHRAILRAAFALPMSDRDLALFREVAERDPPTEPARELWMIAGRGSGKDSVASLIAVYFAVFRSWSGIRGDQSFGCAASSEACFAVSAEAAATPAGSNRNSVKNS